MDAAYDAHKALYDKTREKILLIKECWGEDVAKSVVIGANEPGWQGRATMARATNDLEFCRRMAELADTTIAEHARGDAWKRLAPEPIPMVLHCTSCGLQHVDTATESWPNPPHRSHLCAGCGNIWRPADVPTVGVAAILTKGKADRPIAPSRANRWARCSGEKRKIGSPPELAAPYTGRLVENLIQVRYGDLYSEIATTIDGVDATCSFGLEDAVISTQSAAQPILAIPNYPDDSNIGTAVVDAEGHIIYAEPRDPDEAMSFERDHWLKMARAL